MSLAPAETGATVAHLMLLGDELPAAVFALGRPCILTVTVQLQLVPRATDGAADSGSATSPWPGFFNFSYQHPLDLVHLFGTMGPRRDFTLSLTGKDAEGDGSWARGWAGRVATSGGGAGFLPRSRVWSLRPYMPRLLPALNGCFACLRRGERAHSGQRAGRREPAVLCAHCDRERHRHAARPVASDGRLAPVLLARAGVGGWVSFGFGFGSGEGRGRGPQMLCCRYLSSPNPRTRSSFRLIMCVDISLSSHGRETKALPEKPGHGRMGPRASLISIGTGRAAALTKGTENLVAYSLENNVHLGYDPAHPPARIRDVCSFSNPIRVPLFKGASMRTRRCSVAWASWRCSRACTSCRRSWWTPRRRSPPAPPAPPSCSPSPCASWCCQPRSSRPAAAAAWPPQLREATTAAPSATRRWLGRTVSFFLHAYATKLLLVGGFCTERRERTCACARSGSCVGLAIRG